MQVFGAEYVAAKRQDCHQATEHRRFFQHFQQKSTSHEREIVHGGFLQRASTLSAGATDEKVPANDFEKARLALIGLGYRKEEANRAISEVMKQNVNETTPLERVLREALRLLAA